MGEVREQLKQGILGYEQQLLWPSKKRGPKFPHDSFHQMDDIIDPRVCVVMVVEFFTDLDKAIQGAFKRPGNEKGISDQVFLIGEKHYHGYEVQTLNRLELNMTVAPLPGYSDENSAGAIWLFRPVVFEGRGVEIVADALDQGAVIDLNPYLPQETDETDAA